jgi:hypothetical protein
MFDEVIADFGSCGDGVRAAAIFLEHEIRSIRKGNGSELPLPQGER